VPENFLLLQTSQANVGVSVVTVQLMSMNLLYSHWLTVYFAGGIFSGEYVAIFKSQLIISQLAFI
jgi:hypothetical protein